MSALSTRNSVLCPQVTMSGLPTGIMTQAAGAEKSSDHETARNVRFENSPKCNLALVTQNSAKLKPLMMNFRCATF